MGAERRERAYSLTSARLPWRACDGELVSRSIAIGDSRERGGGRRLTIPMISYNIVAAPFSGAVAR